MYYKLVMNTSMRKIFVLYKEKLVNISVFIRQGTLDPTLVISSTKLVHIVEYMTLISNFLIFRT